MSVIRRRYVRAPGGRVPKLLLHQLVFVDGVATDDADRRPHAVIGDKTADNDNDEVEPHRHPVLGFDMFDDAAQER